MLLRAADLVNERDTCLPAGPWFAKHQRVWAEDLAGQEETVVEADAVSYDVARWIALLSPSVAPHLEALLRETADGWASEAARPFYSQGGEFRREHWFSQTLRQSPEYRLALALLGEEQG